MKKNINKKDIKLPTTKELELELKSEKYKFRYKSLLKSTIYTLIIVIAISVLIATLFFPVLQIYGTSMEPVLKENDIVVTLKKTEFKRGDIIAFYYNNRILVKRIIATSSEWINVDNEGNIYINDNLLDEPYIKEKSLGESDIEYPYQVPEGSYFVIGDQRTTSLDSRNNEIGSIPKEDIIGKIIFKTWPFKRIGIIK